MADPIHIERRKDGEAGYMLLAVVVMIALILIALSVAAPVIAKDLRRDKEVESEHRAQQYVRGIRMYYAKTKSYPPSMEALLKSNNIRFLRQKYVDPLTGKSDWRIIHQPKTKTHYPFGQELAGMAAGLGSAAGMAGGVGQTVGGTTTVGQTSGLGAGFAGATVADPTSGAPGANGAAGTNGTSGTPGSNGSTGSTGSTGSSDGGMFGDSAGGVIYGVGPNKSGDSILTPNQQTTYETWEFWYDPLIELLYAKGVPTGGGGMGSQSATSLGGSSSGSGGNTGSFGGGLGSGFNNGAAGSTGATGSTGTSSSTGTSGPGSGGFGSSTFP
jgi:type II secretory pathway pseudopilin PulG